VSCEAGAPSKLSPHLGGGLGEIGREDYISPQPYNDGVYKIIVGGIKSLLKHINADKIVLIVTVKSSLSLIHELLGVLYLDALRHMVDSISQIRLVCTPGHTGAELGCDLGG
jgi:hypothetical protein